ncbi:MAG: hypothetical protein ACLQQ4_06650 [Bacteroidia bacterium]
MKRITGTATLIIFSLSLSINAQAQNIGINTTGAAPSASAILDLSNTANLGFLAPGVALTASNAAAPITNPATGLMVYNTATAGIAPHNVVPGYYYNAGTAIAPNWLLFTTYSTYGTNIQDPISDNTLFSNSTEGFTTTATVFTQVTGSTLTISAEGTYLILANAEINSTSNNDNAAEIVMEDITNTLYYGNSVPYVADWVEWSTSTIVTLTASATYEIKIASNSAAKTAMVRNARITYIKVQ